MSGSEQTLLPHADAGAADASPSFVVPIVVGILWRELMPVDTLCLSSVDRHDGDLGVLNHVDLLSTDSKMSDLKARLAVAEVSNDGELALWKPAVVSVERQTMDHRPAQFIIMDAEVLVQLASFQDRPEHKTTGAPQSNLGSGQHVHTEILEGSHV